MTEPQQRGSERVRAFAQEQIKPRARQVDRMRHFSTEMISGIRCLGAAGSIVPQHQ